MLLYQLLLLFYILCFQFVKCKEFDDNAMVLRQSGEMMVQAMEISKIGSSIGNSNNYKLIRPLDQLSIELLAYNDIKNDDLNKDMKQIKSINDSIEDSYIKMSLKSKSNLYIRDNQTDSTGLVFLRYDNDLYDDIIEDFRERCSISSSIYNISEEAFAGGRFGHVWLGKSNNISDVDYYVLKRISNEKSIEKLLSARRELYFGLYLHEPGIIRFEECYIEQIAININVRTFRPDKLIYIPWLIYKYEGQSLYNLIYSNNHGIIQPSSFWMSLQKNEYIFKQIFYQLFKILSILNKKNILHRDLKLDNICVTKQEDLYKITLIDWGSAMNISSSSSSSSLYPHHVPSINEVTPLYAPPEINENNQFPQFNNKYDIWSTGIMMLEMLLGHKNIYQCSQRMIIHIKRSNPHASEEEIEKRCHDTVYNHLCIYTNDIEDSERCIQLYMQPYLISINQNNNRYIIRYKDRLSLIHLLLQHNPQNRLLPEQALLHPYFKSFLHKDTIDEIYK